MAKNKTPLSLDDVTIVGHCTKSGQAAGCEFILVSEGRIVYKPGFTVEDGKYQRQTFLKAFPFLEAEVFQIHKTRKR